MVLCISKQFLNFLTKVEVMSINKREIWDNFCNENKILEKGVPLFKTIELNVEVFEYGVNQRKMLRRSNQMESIVRDELNKVITDFQNSGDHYEGLIYMMFWKKEGRLIPLYIGKSEKFGKKGRNLSENLIGYDKFCRWGYNYQYHIGNLSAVVLNHPNKQSRKYKKWADLLFKSVPSENPELREQTYFWIKAWENGSAGPWEDFGATSLTFLEYLLIGLTSDIFPEVLLNDEGVNRK